MITSPETDPLAGLAPQAVAQRQASNATLQDAAQRAGLILHRIDVPAGADQAQLISVIARALRFPQWFGGNLDALYDSLTDRAGGGLLVLRGLPRGDASAAILDVFRDAADDFATRQRPFVVLYDFAKP